MPLHGKIVVIKRSGGDGTEFPLTATCLFGRKPDCDIRIQLPQVSKEHCRIDLNENKEVILTNLSSVNPTRVNGEALQQSERLKHGDVITIIDRSFRFEYPPAPTPKKRSSIGGKTETFKVLQDQQLGDTVTSEIGEKRISEVSTDPHLKDGTNLDNIQRSLEKTLEVESKEDDSLLQNKTTSPFNDLYQMIKKSLDVKTPRKSCASLLQTPSSKICTPRPVSVRRSGVNSAIPTDKSTPKKDEAKVSGADAPKEDTKNERNGTPKSVKKQRKSFEIPSTVMTGPEDENPVKVETPSPQKRNRTPPQRFTVNEVIEQVSTPTPKSPVRRRSKEATPAKPAVTKEQDKQAVTSPKTKSSPRNSGKVEKGKALSTKRKSGELLADLPTTQMKKKRVSFGGHLSPELFDKRLPPDSPLRKGATPRRSLSLFKPKQSLLRRASVIGLLQEFDQEHSGSPKGFSPATKKTPPPGKKSPKSRSPSPKAATPAKKSPKSRSPSPKAATPTKKSPKSGSTSPKAATPAKMSPKSKSPSPKAATPAKKSPKAATPAKKSPNTRSPSPKATTPAKSTTLSPAKGRSPARNKMETPKANQQSTPGLQTPTVQGRFSVSRISTPSPVAEDAVTDQVPLVMVTPKIPLRRKSMKSTSRKSTVKSAVKVMRRSGISRASIKALNSYADIVKFGQTKAQVAPPAKAAVTKKTVKKAVLKPKTPARKLKGHVSTGHADSPATIVVGRAHKQKVVHPTGAAPRLVTNIALLKKNLKMDEDLTGISEMYKTPVNERKQRSVINENIAMKTPVVALGTSMVEPSVLNTPEEPGEMMVSPLSVSVKDGRYNSEAVRRLLDADQETGMVSDITTEETHSDDEQQGTDLMTTSVNTPKQKPELPECLTGVKRIMKTPRQKAEPVEDLRGKLLKTPKQKPEQQECLTGVKRIMRTPREKAEPVEDLRGRLLKTPKQKPEQQECLSGVKRIMKTPRQKAEPVEDLRGNILKTPKQKPQEHDCLTGVKQIFETPKWEPETVEDLEEKLLEAGDAVAETPAQMQASEDLPEMTDMTTPNTKSSPAACLTGVKRIMKTPKEKSAPVEDMLGVKRLMKTPKEKFEAVEENFGIKRLVKTPRLRGKAPVEDFEGLKELMDEPVPEATEQLEPKEVDDQTPLDCDVDVAQELDFANEEPQDDVKLDVIGDVPQVEMEQEADAKEVVADDYTEVPSGHENKSSDASETATQVTVDEISPMEELKVDTVDELGSEEEPMMEVVAESVPEEQPKADEILLEDEPKVVAVDDTGSEGEPKVEAVDEAVSEEQPQIVETVPEEPAMEAVDEASEEQPKAGAVDETVCEEPIVEAVDETVTEEQPKVEAVDAVSEEQPQIVETVPEEPAMEAVDEKMEKQPKVEKKSVRGRRAKAVESKPAEEEQEAAEQSEDAVIPAPVRGRRGKKTEATAPPAVRQTTRGRNAKTTESMDAELAVEESASVPSKVAPKPKRGRNAKKASDDQTEMIQEVPTETEMVPEPVIEQSPPVDEVDDSAAPVEKVVVKPKRGRKTKQPEEAVPEQQDVPSTDSDNVPQVDTEKEAEANEVCSDLIEVLPSGGDENKSSDAEETVSQASVAERLPEEETSTCKEPVPKKSVRGRRVKVVKSKPADDKQEVVEHSQAADETVPEEQPKMAEPVLEEQPKVEAVDETVPEEQSKVEKKSGRGRRGKAVESKPAEEKQEVVEPSEDPVVPAPVRGRRGKKAAAAPAVRQTTRGRNAKSQSAPVEQPEMEPEKSVETPVTEVSTEAESDHTIVVKTLEANDPAEETAVKPIRGRKTKQTPVEPQPEPAKTDVSEEHLEADVELRKSVPAVAKPRRGRKTKADSVEQNEEAEEAVVPVETKQESQPPVRAKRGRNAKQEEDENDDKTTSVETTQSQEPVKKSRRTKKEEQENTEPCVEAQSSEQADPEEAAAPVVAEAVKMDEPAAVAAKPRRGGRKAKQDTETETPVESTKIQEVPAVSSDKPKRGGRRAKQITEEVEVTAVVPEDKPEPEAEEKNVELDAPVVKTSRARGAKSEVPQAVPAKRARRGAASSAEETSADSTISDSAPPLVEPAKRGRRAAAKPTADAAAKEASEEVKPTEDSSSAVDEDKKNSKKSVKWKTNVEVYEIPKPTPVKAARGRKSKLADQVDTESQNVPEDASKTEETDLSDTVAEAQPAKRVRRGAKTADKHESTSEEKSEAETQPKTRRGRSAKK